MNYLSWLTVVSSRNKYFLEQIAKLFLFVSVFFKIVAGIYTWSQTYLTKRQEINLVSLAERRRERDIYYTPVSNQV